MSPMDLAQLISQRQNLQYVLDNLSEGVLAHDTDRLITFFNRAAEQITGYDRDDVVGKDCHEAFDGGFCGTLCRFTTDNTVVREKIERDQHFVSKSGQRKRITVSVIPMTDEHGEFVGVLNVFRDMSEVDMLRRRLQSEQCFNGIIGRDHQMQLVFDLIGDLADSEVPVLIQGESGTGKELVAGAIHGESDRSGRPFIAVNCGALPEGTLESELFGHVKGAFTGAYRDKKGRFELADGGTIFLDEVGELPQPTQVRLLRVLQDGTFERVGGEHVIRVDVRVISATNRDLRKMVAKGEFREDLFYRLCVVPVTLPPLRDRRNDIPLLATHFLRATCEENGRAIPVLSQGTMGILIDYSWPGNVRELQNAIQYALVKCKGDAVDPRHLPPEILGPKAELVGQAAPPRPRRRVRKLNAQEVQEALSECGGNKAQAARRLGVGRATLYRFLDELGRT
ncbi:MAG: sigma 54-interacting transcriptional regulator [Phycisphaerae bacterium]|nr:sigma 54-interacting transcriptional regulator [Phycisphaerae bacterium]